MTDKCIISPTSQSHRLRRSTFRMSLQKGAGPRLKGELDGGPGGPVVTGVETRPPMPLPLTNRVDSIVDQMDTRAISTAVAIGSFDFVILSASLKSLRSPLFKMEIGRYSRTLALLWKKKLMLSKWGPAGNVPTSRYLFVLTYASSSVRTPSSNWAMSQSLLSCKGQSELSASWFLCRRKCGLIKCMSQLTRVAYPPVSH